MTTGTRHKSPYPSAREGAASAQRHADSAQCKSDSYRLAFQDPEFLLRDDLRSVRLQLELLKPEIILREQHIESTVVVFGSSRLVDPETAEARLVSAQTEYDKKKEDPLLVRKLAAARHALENSRYYSEARKLGHLISSNTGKDKLVVITGGGPGIMEAANKGAKLAGGSSIGLNISIPFEQFVNKYVDEELAFEFHYFFMRKFWFAYLSKALVIFPGGFGTMDELFEVLTLVQTEKIKKKLILIIYDEKYWKSVLNFDELVDKGMISESDLKLFNFCNNIDEAFNKIVDHLKKHYAKEKEPQVIEPIIDLK